MMLKKKILAIDDDKSVLDSINMILKDTYEVVLKETAQEGIDLFKRSQIDLVILDLRLPDRTGLDVLKEMKEYNAEVPILMLTAVQDTRAAVEAMKLGAIDYLSKPFNVDEINLVIERTLSEQDLRKKVLNLEEEMTRIYQFENIVGKSPAMLEFFRSVTQVMNQDTTALILGESGTGKELAARAVHYNGKRKHGPFIPLDCSAIPRDIMESELFGHERGAFTGAYQRRAGAFELAHGGTLFLDEIGELPLEVQSKLLRVIQERKFRRVGGTESIHVDIRIIAATNQKLSDMVEKGEFRKDLFYRIHVIPLTLPPLRQRKEDIPLLAHHFLRHLSKKVETCVKILSSDFIQSLGHYDWPGNVRELENMMERLLVTVEETELKSFHFRKQFVQDYDFEEPAIGAPLMENFSLERACGQFEKKIILDALKVTEGKIGKTAEKLKTTRRILKYKMDSLGINSYI